jgi:capsular polysaccharide biosynthesis protein/Mrp family chromosome partitioning ATPase
MRYEPSNGDGQSSRIGQRGPEWVGEAPPSGGLTLYLELLRSRIWVIALIVAVSVAAAAIHVAVSNKVYKADANMLVTALPSGDDTLFGLGLVSESSDPTRDVETLAQLITTPSVAARVRAKLALDRSSNSLLKDVSAVPVASSSIVTITAKADNPTLAANIANAFGQAAIDERTARLHRLLDSVIPQIKGQLEKLPANQTAARDALNARLQDLQTLRLLKDPTLHLETRAVPPTSAVQPRPVLSIAAAFLAALVLAVGVVLGWHILDNRVRREEDLRRYRIPILGRVPLERPKRPWPLTPGQLMPATLDAYRRLASSLAYRTDSNVSPSRSIFVTSATPGDGKTPTSINLAAALSELNQRVILAETDSRRPSLGRALALTQDRGTTSVVTGRSTLDEALEQTARMPGVSVLSQEPGSGSAPPQFSPNTADTFLREAQFLTDWTVVDGPALTYGTEALPVATRVDMVVVVVRLGNTRGRDLAELAELLMQQEITPDGFIVVGGRTQQPYYYH